MGTEPTPAEELDQPATKRFVSNMIKLAETRLKDELKPLSEQEIKSMIDRAIRELKSDLETTRRDHERAESETKWKRQEEWFRRLTCGVIGAVASFLFFIIVSQCTSNIRDVEHRISTLESKQPK